MHKGVFSPAISRSTEFFARQLVARCSGKSVLEVGCGCGAIAILCALHGASNVVATDMNEVAVQCARDNVTRHHVNSKVTVIEGEFQDLRAKFDIVFFALPYVYVSNIAEMVERFGKLAYSVFDPRYCHQGSFFRYAESHTRPGGEILAGFGGAGNVGRFQQNLKRNNLRGQELARAREGRSDNRLYLLNPIRREKARRYE